MSDAGNNKNRDAIEKYSQTVWNDKDLSVVDALFSKNAIIHSPLAVLEGPEAMKKIIRSWLASFPDLQLVPEDFICEGDRVVVRWTATGTHKKELKGIFETRNTVKYSGVAIYRFKDDKVVEYWTFVNLFLPEMT